MPVTYIQDIPDDVRERLREEIFRNLGQRRDDATQAFSEVSKYMGIIISGGTIAILSFIGTRKDTPIPAPAIVSLSFFVFAILSYLCFLYIQYQLYQSRWNAYADVANDFFTRQASLEDIISVGNKLRSRWPHRLFWIPFIFTALGFLSGIASVLPIPSGK
jgi:hypothetical protein